MKNHIKTVFKPIKTYRDLFGDVSVALLDHPIGAPGIGPRVTNKVRRGVYPGISGYTRVCPVVTRNPGIPRTPGYTRHPGYTQKPDVPGYTRVSRVYLASLSYTLYM